MGMRIGNDIWGEMVALNWVKNDVEDLVKDGSDPRETVNRK